MAIKDVPEWIELAGDAIDNNIEENQLIVASNIDTKAVHSINSILMETIEKVSLDPEYINQANTINELS